MKTKALKRDDRKRQILLAFAVNFQNGFNGEMTVADIAKAMHIAPSTKLRIMLNELVVDGVLDFRTEDIPGVAKFRRIYAPNKNSFKVPTPRYIGQERAIRINSRQGSFLAQLEE